MTADDKASAKKKKIDKDAESECKDIKIAELTNDLKRLQADFENFKKRSEKEQCNFEKHASRKLMTDLLPIIDSLELSLKHKDDKEFSNGVEVLYKQFIQTLARHGLRKIPTRGKQFDPYVHEVLMQEHDPTKEDELITEELQAGYMFHDLLLRTSKVKINKKKDDNQTNSAE